MIAMAQAGPRRADKIQYRLIYMATLPAFLLVVAVSRLIGLGPVVRGPVVHGTAARGGAQSILGEAKAAAQTCGSLSLMG